MDLDNIKETYPYFDLPIAVQKKYLSTKKHGIRNTIKIKNRNWLYKFCNDLPTVEFDYQKERITIQQKEQLRALDFTGSDENSLKELISFSNLYNGDPHLNNLRT